LAERPEKPEGFEYRNYSIMFGTEALLVFGQYYTI